MSFMELVELVELMKLMMFVMFVFVYDQPDGQYLDCVAYARRDQASDRET